MSVVSKVGTCELVEVNALHVDGRDAPDLAAFLHVILMLLVSSLIPAEQEGWFNLWSTSSCTGTWFSIAFEIGDMLSCTFLVIFAG